jgi:hypothetical protein
MEINICTYFDQNYLTKFLACKSSIKNYEKNVKFFCLCLDNFSLDYLSNKNYSDLIIISIKEIENYFPELKIAKQNRELIEFYFTLSPFLPLYILEKFQVNIINYVDSDIFFFDTPKKLIRLLGNESIMIAEHGIKDNRFGKYNVGWLTFRNDNNALRCLKDWGKDCINWCHDYVDGDKYADQKYLDKWPFNYNNVVTLPSKYSLGPWNLSTRDILIKKNKIKLINNELIFYHFHGLNIFKNFYSTGLSIYNKRLPKNIVKLLYGEYLNKLFKLNKIIKISKKNIRNRNIKKNLKQSLIKLIKNLVRFIKILIFFDIYKI